MCKAPAGIHHRACRTMRPMMVPAAAPMNPASLIRRRRALLGALAVAALAGAGCNGALGPRSVTLSLEQMQDKVSARFPRRYPLAGLAELNLQAPRLALRPEQNRINVVMALEATGPVLRRAYRLDPARVQSLVGMEIPADVQIATLRALGFRTAIESCGWGRSRWWMASSCAS